MLQVTGQPPLEAVPAYFSNFLGIARVGTEVQFEFIFVDINQLATMVQSAKDAENTETPRQAVVGQTVVKVVMPAQSFIQLQSHLETIFKDIRAELEKQQPGETDARKRVNS